MHGTTKFNLSLAWFFALGKPHCWHGFMYIHLTWIIVKCETNISFIHVCGIIILPLMFLWLPNYRTCHGLQTVFAWCCFFKQRIEENNFVFQAKNNSYQPKGKFGNFATKTSQFSKFQTLQHKCCKNHNPNFKKNDNPKFKKSKIQYGFFYISTWLTT